MKKIKIKKQKNKLSTLDKVTLGICLSCLTVTGSIVTKNTIISNKKYLKPISQIERDAEFLNADMMVMERMLETHNINSNELIRLKPNGKDEPIYINLDKSIDSKLATHINSSLNYIEDVFSNINDNYTFKIVNDFEYNVKKAIGKTTIKYECNDIVKSNTSGTAYRTLNKSFFDDVINNNERNLYYTDCTIVIDEKSYINYSESNILTVLNHELLHCFGLGDIYYGKVDTGSFMRAQNGYFINFISPNDFRMLYSAYGDKHLNKDGTINIKKLTEIKEKLNLYENEYYNFVAKNLIEKKDLKNIMDIDKSDFNNRGFVTHSYYTDNNKTNSFMFKFEIKDDKAKIIIYKDNKEVQNCEGNIYYGKNYMIVKDFEIITTNADGSKNFENSYYYFFKDNKSNIKVISIEALAKMEINKQYKVSNDNLEMIK